MSKRDIAFLSICALLSACLLPEFICRPIFGDDAGYWFGAEQVMLGEKPFVDFWCIDPPGIWISFMIGRFLAGPSAMGYWCFIAAHLVLTAILAAMLTRQISKSWVAAGSAGLLLMIVMTRSVLPFALVGKDYIALPFILAGFVADKSRWRLLLSPFCFGFAASIKPQLGLFWFFWLISTIWPVFPVKAASFKTAMITSLTFAVPILATYGWAEINGWGIVCIKSIIATGSHYGSYTGLDTLVKWSHCLFQLLWLVPLAAVGAHLLFQNRGEYAYRSLVTLAVGGAFTWILQPMFNTWYAAPFTAALCIAAGIGVGRFWATPRQALLFISMLGLYSVFTPSTSLRWTKLLYDKKYSLVDHYSREMVSLGKGNTTAAEQRWIRTEVDKYISKQGRCGVLFNDSTLLLALGTRSGFYNFFWPTLYPKRLLEDVERELPDVIIATEPQEHPPSPFQDRWIQLEYTPPLELKNAIESRYSLQARKYGFAIYVRKSLLGNGPHNKGPGAFEVGPQ
jgi:hypothetical protein